MPELTVGYVAGIIAFGIVIGELASSTRRVLLVRHATGHEGNSNLDDSPTMVSNCHDLHPRWSTT